MFNTYFELASNNNTGESIAFVVADITFKVDVMTYSVAKISFFVVNITFVVTEIVFEVAVMTSSVGKITSTVADITYIVIEITFNVAVVIS